MSKNETGQTFKSCITLSLGKIGQVGEMYLEKLEAIIYTSFDYCVLLLPKWIFVVALEHQRLKTGKCD